MPVYHIRRRMFQGVRIRERDCMKTVFISGVSSGIGRGLAEEYIRRGDQVFAIGLRENKSLISHPRFSFVPIDLSDADLVLDTLYEFVHKRSFDLAILNAAIYPPLRDMTETTLEEMRHTMDINVWSHKNVIDALLGHAHVEQIVALSASPARFNHPGFGAFAISKATLNALIELYAVEFPHIHFGALAPSLIQTPTLSRFLKASDPIRYPVIQTIRDSLMLPLDQATPLLIDAIEELKRLHSGCFAEMKKLLPQQGSLH